MTELAYSNVYRTYTRTLTNLTAWKVFRHICMPSTSNSRFLVTKRQDGGQQPKFGMKCSLQRNLTIPTFKLISCIA